MCLGVKVFDMGFVYCETPIIDLRLSYWSKQAIKQLTATN